MRKKRYAPTENRQVHGLADSFYDRYRIECDLHTSVLLGFCQAHILKFPAYSALEGKFSFTGEVIQGHIEYIRNVV